MSIEVSIEQFRAESPMTDFLRMERMPHIWCPGCGIGTVVNSFAEAVKKSGIDMDKLAVISGIGCTGRVAGYVNFDSIHTTHGRAIPVATGLKLANPDMKVVVVSGDGDLTGIGGNHFIHAARRNMDIMVICVNNFTYGMTGGQVTPTTPQTANASTTPYGNYEYPFSLPFLADACGATYVARWTSLHARNITKSIREALNHKGFSFIEVIAPCTTLYQRRNRLGDGLDALEYYKEDAGVEKDVDTRDVGIDFQGDIVMGRFVNQEKPTYYEAVNERYANVLGDDYQLYGMSKPEREEKAKREAEERTKVQALMEDEEAQMMAEDMGVDEEGL
ncbi:MAG: 2-oxoacid:ferredoxin oxidoreductase subunit beta [Chromatiales bacterium]|nr:2-oxoacid:ferredoxin oxidoreductase subunit beta [Gammaproteobacteria bacterium]